MQQADGVGEVPRRRVRVRVWVEGIVQGVGFRPYVHTLATRHHLAGTVRNDASGVSIDVEGNPESVAAFVEELPRLAPPLSVLERLSTEMAPPLGRNGFVIAASAAAGPARVQAPPDVATCADCLQEMANPADRRFRYPFTNCTNCGPRFTIICDLPYDRAATTMAAFPMCAACAREYHDPADRRFHAQPVSCPNCGPRLRLLSPDGTQLAGDPVAETVRLLRAGLIVAVKGLGGYHLAARAGSEPAVAALRVRKAREDKPFALLVRDVAAAGGYAHVDADEGALLSAPERPIVLLTRRTDPAARPVAASVAPDNRTLGLMLPYTPLHHLLADELAEAIVLTSGNISDEPIAYRDEEALERLRPIADRFLVHDRQIHVRVEDSVARVVAGRPSLLRRSRGYAPRPVSVPWPFARPVLACGAELKNTFCLARGTHAFLSQHVGDLENAEALRSYEEGVVHLSRLLDVQAGLVAYDLHPEYLSTKYAKALRGPVLVGVQHHHAHVASCLADNQRADPVIGVAFDGLGFGTDGTMWGGEVLVADLVGFERVAAFETIPMPGGGAAVREPWRMAAAYLSRLAERAQPGAERILPREAAPTTAPITVLTRDAANLRERNAERWEQVLAIARSGVHSPLTSSAGRLFDAVAALLDVRDRVTYEGQAAIELEQRADPREQGTYLLTVTEGAPRRMRGSDLVLAVLADRAAGVPAPVVAARFHNGVAAAVVAVAERVRADTGISTVALSGGVFQNVLLVERCVAGLRKAGFEVLTHARIPTNDGGISLGQAVIAGACDRAGLFDG